MCEGGGGMQGGGGGGQVKAVIIASHTNIYAALVFLHVTYLASPEIRSTRGGQTLLISNYFKKPYIITNTYQHKR